jgi:phosphoribosylformylglycinamidine synthase
VAPIDGIFYGRASGVGNPIMYVGAKTGRDGIHGATMASDEFSDEGPSQRPTVQVGDPFMEKLLVEACLEIFAADLLIGIQDMGAAGLTSSSVEMAARSGSGLEIDLDRVPRRARGLQPYEMLLSESQERMLLVAKPGCEERVTAICEKWGLDVATIGKVTETGRWVVKATAGYDPLSDSGVASEPTVVCDLPVGLLADDAPSYDRPRGEDASLPHRHAFDASSSASRDWGKQLLELCGSPNLGSRQWVWRQYDHIVRGGTRLRPGADAAVVRVPCERDGTRVDKWLAFASDGNGRLCELDPFQGGAMALAEACRNLVCVGAEPIGVTDCLNFGSPERPHVMDQFARAIDGVADACRALDVPVVGGNVSFYNETDGRAILPTPTIAAVGLVQREEHVTPSSFTEAGLTVLLLGAAQAGPMGGSEYVAALTGEVKGTPPHIDLALEARLQKLLLSLIRVDERIVQSAHDVSEGGLAVALAECCVARADGSEAVGATVELMGDEPLAALLFGEAPSRVIVSCRAGDAPQIAQQARAGDVPVCEIGTTGGDALELRRDGDRLLRVALSALHEARENCLAAIVGT